MNLVLVDNSEIFRKGLIELLKDINDLNIIADIPHNNLHKLEVNEKIDVVVMDLVNNTKINYLSVDKLKNHFPKAHLISFSNFENTEFESSKVNKHIDLHLDKKYEYNNLKQYIQYLINRKYGG